MNKLQKFSIAAIIPILLAVIFSFYVDIKLVIIILFSVILVESYIIWKEKIGQQLIVALLIAVALNSYYIYTYTGFNILIGKLNLFSVIGWTAGLVLLREVYERLKIKNKFFVVVIMYIIGLFLVEYIGYNLLGIKLDSNYPGLFGLPIIHMPSLGKLFYLVAGPIYLLITDYLKVK